MTDLAAPRVWPNDPPILLGSPLIPLGDGFVGREQPPLMPTAGVVPAPKVLWLHGYTLDSRSWGSLWGRLPDHHHLAVDLPGHGGAEPMDPDSDLPTLARRLAALIRRHEVTHLVALSFGTITATQIAIDHPDCVRTFTLAAPSLAGAPQDAEVEAGYRKLFGLYFARVPRGLLRETWLDCRAWRGVNERVGLRAALGQLVDDHSWAELANYGIRQFTTPDQTFADLQRITTPLLILLGDREMPAFCDCGAWLAQHAACTETVILPDTDHLCLLMSPAPSVAAMQAFWAKHPPSRRD